MKNWTRIGLAALGPTMLATTAYAQEYTIGVSNTVQGNGWREEMICAIKAQALASGKGDNKGEDANVSADYRLGIVRTMVTRALQNANPAGTDE